MKVPSLSVTLTSHADDYWIVLSRGELASIKIRLDEATRVADRLVDAAERANHE